MTLRVTLISTLCAAALAGPASGALGEQGPHRSLVIGGDCVECTFEGANLAGAQFLGGDFRGANFDSAELLGARLIDLNLESANFHNASLIEAHFANTDLSGANLEDVQLDRSRFHQTDLAAANLTDVTMNEAVLFVADLSGAELKDVSANSAVFRQVVFDAARARDAQFTNAHFNGSSMSGADLRRVNFSGAIIENVDLSGADLRETNFENARLSSVNLSGADLRNAGGLTQQSLSYACGSNVRGLPDGVELSSCVNMNVMAQQERAFVAFASTLENQVSAREERLAQIAIARSAFEEALANVEIQVGQSERVRLEALAAAREGWEAAAEALAEAETELAGATSEMEWSFEIRRAELGEPIRVILEQANPRRVIVGDPNAVVPPPPPSPPAPDLPRRVTADVELLGSDSRVREETRERAAVIAREAARENRVRISAADIGFLIDATSRDFGARADAQSLDFRDVQAGVWRSPERADRAVLCGEVELEASGNGTQWERFATVRTSGYEVRIGGAADAICDDDAVQIRPSADLAIRIEQGIARLAQ